MSKRVEFSVAGIPRPQGSMTAFVPKGWTRAVVTHKKAPELLSWRESVKQACLSRHRDTKLSGPLNVELRFTMPIPKSRPKSVSTDAQKMEWQWPAKKPDLDKLVRAIWDALSGVLFDDDSQIVCVCASKAYGDHPGVQVMVEEML